MDSVILLDLGPAPSPTYQLNPRKDGAPSGASALGSATICPTTHTLANDASDALCGGRDDDDAPTKKTPC